MSAAQIVETNAVAQPSIRRQVGIFSSAPTNRNNWDKNFIYEEINLRPQLRMTTTTYDDNLVRLRPRVTLAIDCHNYLRHDCIATSK